MKIVCRIKYFDLSLHYQNKKQVSQLNNKDMEAIINTISAQAVELLKNQHIAAMLAERTRSQVVQVIGKKIVLYKEGKDDKKKIVLP